MRWVVQDYKQAHIHAGRGVVLRNFPLTSGHGFADYLLYVDGKAAGIVEAKKEGFTLTGVEVQSEKYTKGEGRRCRFTSEQIHWLEMIRNHVAANLVVEPDDFEYAPFAQEGGLGKVHRLFPEGLQLIIEALTWPWWPKRRTYVDSRAHLQGSAETSGHTRA